MALGGSIGAALCQVVGVEVVGESGLLKLKPSKTGFEVW